MKKIFLILSLIFSTFIKAELKIYTEDSPPFNYVKDGKADGFAVAIVEEIKKRLKNTTALEVVSWARGYNELTNGQDVLLFSTARTPQREDLFQWVGPIGEKQWIFVQKVNFDRKIKNLEDAKTVKSIGVYKEDSKEQFLKANNFNNIDAVMNDEQNLTKLIEGRIELWATGNTNLKLFLQKPQYKDLKNKIKVSLVFERKELYLAFSKNVNAEVVKKWQEALDKMKKDGTFQKIRKKFINEIE